MAETQISRIQIRRGLQEDLPELASAEMAWSIDQRRLFIGNGSLEEGAPVEGMTEILTEFTDIVSVLENYSFKGLEAGYNAQAEDLAPIQRSLQNKLDDFVNVRDLGVTGDGITNDVAAINKIFTRIYKETLTVTNPIVRRTIYFPAGIYVLSQDFVRLLPWLSIRGDGKDKTIIKQTDASQPCVVRTADHLHQIDTNMIGTGSTLPKNMDIRDVTFWNATSNDVLILDSTQNSEFTGVGFVGSNKSNGKSLVKVRSIAQETTHVNFRRCDFVNCGTAFDANDISSSIIVDNGWFSVLNTGFKLGATSSSASAAPRRYRIENSKFDQIDDRAIYVYPNSSAVVSAYNVYRDVGNTNNVPVIDYWSDENYSIADSFDRAYSDSRLQIDWHRKRVGILNTNYNTAQTVVILDSQTTAYNSNVALIDAGSFSYTLERNGNTRSGTGTFVSSGTSINFDEEYTEFIDLGIEFSANAGNLYYTSTSTGFDANLTITIKK